MRLSRILYSIPVHTICLAMGLAICLGGLAACNTVEGLGKDIQKAGSSLEKAGKDDE